MSKVFEIPEWNVRVEAGSLHLGQGIRWGRDVQINVRGALSIGDWSFVGDRFRADCESLTLGQHFYNNPSDSRGLIIGGGSSHLPEAHVRVGNRCVCHTGHWNCAKPIEIGDDCGLSHDVDILTHGFWGSVFEGNPRSFESVTLGNNVSIGWKTVIMPGCVIPHHVTVGANSTVTKGWPGMQPNAIYAGSPAKKIRDIKPLDEGQTAYQFNKIVTEFEHLMSYYDLETPLDIAALWPVIKINDLEINVLTQECQGQHDRVTDAFRDFLRRYGVRVFHPRGFKWNLARIK